MTAGRSRAILAVVALGTFMTALDASIVNISLPAIARTFHTSIEGAVQWVIIGYLVVVAATMMTFGRVSDVVGRKPVWMTGLALFTVGSIVCGAAGSVGALVAARALQGLGGAMIFAPGFAIITDAFSPTERGGALGFNAVVFAVATSLGPTLGGVITEHLSWRWIFYLNVPLGVLALLASGRLLPASGSRRREPLDLPGAALIAWGLACVTLALSLSHAWNARRLLVCLGLGVAALAGAALVEHRSGHPMVDPALLREPVLASALASMTVAMLALFAVGFILPFYLEGIRGLSVMASGLLLTPLPLMIGLVAPISGMLADRFGSRWLASGGLALACVGLLLLARLDETSTVVDVVWRLVVIGVGQGLFQSPNARALMNAAPSGEEGQASGLYASSRVLGQTLSVALAGVIFAGLGGGLAGFRGAIHVCAAVGAVGVVVALVRGDDRAPIALPRPGR